MAETHNGSGRCCAIPVCFLALVFAAPVSAADKPSGDSAVVRGGGLMCFSIRPPNSPTKAETKRTPALYQSCDELCAPRQNSRFSAPGARESRNGCYGKWK
jgi:hypothetical protein